MTVPFIPLLKLAGHLERNHDNRNTLSAFFPLLSAALSRLLAHLMASVRRFGSCSSCQLRNSWLNGNERRWKSRSAVPEWLLGSRIKAQGEEEVYTRWQRDAEGGKAGMASQAGGVGHLGVCVCAHVCV